MVFELFDKGTWRGANPLDANSVAIRKSTLRFGSDLFRLLRDYMCVEVYFDKENGLVAFKPSNDSQKGYKLSAHKAKDEF